MATPTPLALYWVYQKYRYPVVQARLQLHQPTDYQGQPNARVGAQVVRFVTDAADAEAQLATYMFDPYRRAHSYFEAAYDSGSTRKCRPLIWCGCRATLTLAAPMPGPPPACIWG